MSRNSDYFLLIDSGSEAVKSKLSTSGINYIGKRLDSGEENWKAITRLARSVNCLGVVAVFYESTYGRLASDLKPVADEIPISIRSMDQSVVDGLLSALSAQPNLILVHEAVLGGAAIYEGLDGEAEDEPPVSWDYGEEWSDKSARDHFGDIDERVRVRANERIASAGMKATPYKRNAEASMLSLAFIEDQQSNLLFRLYVPAGRLFENESAELLRLFHDWLTSVRGKNVRQGGYTTARGRVIEFYAEDRADTTELQGEMQRFQEFLSLVENPSEAATLLIGLGVTPQRAGEIVSRYAIQARRLQIDVKHERERRSLTIRQALESELIDEIVDVPEDVIAEVVDQLLPDGPQLLAVRSPKPLVRSASLVVNQQFINHAEGVIAQNIAGNAIHGLHASDLETLIANHAAAFEQGELLNALREFLDGSAPQKGRLAAKQKLKGFLISVGNKGGQLGVNLLQKWLEVQMGL